MKSTIFTIVLLLLFGGFLCAQPKAIGEPKQVVQMNEPLRTPVWSPDGTKLSFTSLKNNGLWEVSANGTNFRQVSAEVGAGNHLRALAGNNANPLLQKMMNDPANVACQTEALQSLRGSLIFNPVLSPQNDKIVFQASNGKGLYICNADGSDLRSLGKGERATWMPDGKYIVVMQTEDNGEVLTKGELISIHIASGARNTLLSSDKYIALSPAISPDGKKIAFEEYAGGAIYVMNIQ
jgi:Tol biopolymer transport system component